MCPNPKSRSAIIYIIEKRSPTGGGDGSGSCPLSSVSLPKDLRVEYGHVMRRIPKNKERIEVFPQIIGAAKTLGSNLGNYQESPPIKRLRFIHFGCVRRKLIDFRLLNRPSHILGRELYRFNLFTFSTPRGLRDFYDWLSVSRLQRCTVWQSMVRFLTFHMPHHPIVPRRRRPNCSAKFTLRPLQANGSSLIIYISLACDLCPLSTIPPCDGV